MTVEQISSAVEQYCAILTDRWMNTSPVKNRAECQVKYVTESGRKYFKIVSQHLDGTAASVHAFVDKSTGDVYKAASWAQPAKGVRYNLLRDMTLLEQRVDPYGAYLYR